MEDRDKTIEIMRAAMEKEKVMKEEPKKSMEESIDAETPDGMPQDGMDPDMVEDIMEEAEEGMPEDMATEETPDQQELSGEEAAGDQKLPKGGKGLFKNSKAKELAAKDQKIEELTDRFMRTMAEFDNFRKRSEKEKSQMFDYGVKSVVEKMLPIIDNFERGLGTITEKDKEGGFVQGMEMIYKQLLTGMEEIGVKPIDAVGKEFDPAMHNAVMHGEDETLDANIITDEFQKGYLYHDMVVRHSMVKVVN